MFFHCEVTTKPGFTLFTRMFSGASWIANVLVNDRQADRFTLVAQNVGSGYLPLTALLLMIRPLPRARMWGTPAREHRIIENSFTSRSEERRVGKECRDRRR